MGRIWIKIHKIYVFCITSTRCRKGQLETVTYRGGLGVQTPSPLKFRSFDKAVPNFQFRKKYIPNKLIRIQLSLVYKLSGTPVAPKTPFSLPSVLN
jgi:hypothetical protein